MQKSFTSQGLNTYTNWQKFYTLDILSELDKIHMDSDWIFGPLVLMTE